MPLQDSTNTQTRNPGRDVKDVLERRSRDRGEGLSTLTPRVNDSSALDRVLRESARQSPERQLLRRRLDGIGLRENEVDGDGNCHVYVDIDADLALAESVVVNAKMQRPSVCNAAESLVVHADIAAEFLPRIAGALDGVELVGDKRASRLASAIAPADDHDWSTEYLDLKMSVRVVDDLDSAIEHINENSTGHSEAIITRDMSSAQEFTSRVDAAAVLVNTSTRFVDGEEFGFGAEIGISTQKLHARGPMGLEQLTTTKYIVNGQGQIRV